MQVQIIAATIPQGRMCPHCGDPTRSDADGTLRNPRGTRHTCRCVKGDAPCDRTCKRKYKEPCVMCCGRGHYPIPEACPQCNGDGWVWR